MADAAAFDGFYRENLARIARACLLVTLDRATAEDVAAEAFARLWSRWGVIGSEDHGGGYVFKTAMRLCAKEVRRRARRAPVPGAPVDEIGRATERQDIGHALAALSVRQRQVVVLRDWAGFETAEVGRMLGMKESTVRVQLARARGRLRQHLTAHEEEAAT